MFVPMYYVIRIKNEIRELFLSIADERGDGPINYIALLVGLALIAAAVIAAFQAMSGPVGARIREVIGAAIGAGG